MNAFRLRPLIVLSACLLLFTGACGNSDSSSNSNESDPSVTTCLKLAVDATDDVYIGGHTYDAVDDNVHIGEADIFLIKVAADGTRIWSTLIGSTDDDFLRGLTTTTAKATLVAGYTYGTMNNNTSTGGVDMLLIKTAADSSNVWTKQFGTTADDYAYGLATDATGDIYVAGHTYGSFEGSFTGTKDFVLVKLDNAGEIQWSRQISNDEDDSDTAINGVYGIDVKIDGPGNVYAAGFTTGNLPGSSSEGGYDIFVVKYTPSGNRLWLKQLGTAGNDYLQGLEVNTTGDVYLTGYTESEFDGQSSAGGIDLFLVKLDTDANQQWIVQQGTDTTDSINGITLDSSGNVILAGYTSGSLGGSNAGSSDLLIMKYDPDGTLLWTQQNGSDGTELPRAIARDSADRLFLTGYSYGNLDGESNPDEDRRSFISRYSSAGAQSWTRLF